MPCQAISKPEAKGKMCVLGFKGSKLITNTLKIYFWKEITHEKSYIKHISGMHILPLATGSSMAF